MLILLSYDIPDDRRRTRLADALKDFGARVQYSVFEFDLTEPQLDRLRSRVDRLIDEGEDSVRVYRLCGSCADRVWVLGVGDEPARDPQLYLV